MTRIITIAGGKGGVGKTTLSANLGAALADFDRDTTIIDANLTTPNLGLHLGIPLYPVTLHDVLKGKNNIKDAIYEHESGAKIVPAGISLRDLRGTDARDLPNAILDLLGHNDIIILDAAAGLGKEALAAMESADELLLITTPELPAVTDALKAIKLSEQLGAKTTGIIVNRVSGGKHEMKMREIENMLGRSVMGVIPEDSAVHRSIAYRTPVIHYAPRSNAAKAIRQIAADIAGVRLKEEQRKRFRFF
ncbi:MAG: P-loop NTPase [Candidatus Aenigmarchaeota archaeon]|nr:P-loop NTPase [Candidatus Aenigmarchaeota archaeon]